MTHYVILFIVTNPGGNMNYQKKILVLKGTDNSLSINKNLSGLCRIEIENGVAELHLSLVNLPPYSGAEYFALIFDANKHQFEFSLGKRPTSCAHIFSKEPLIEKGFCIGLYSVKEGVPLTTAFASDNSFSLSEFKHFLAEKYISKRKQIEKQQRQSEQNQTCPCVYDDEAVATINYFDLDKEIEQKLIKIKECQNESFSIENELPYCQSQKEEKKECSASCCFQDETDFGECKKNQTRPYFESVKNELYQIFIKFPKEEYLCNIFKDSKWAKINYSSEKFYVVGLIFQNNKEKYICYGVPDVYSKTPPKEFDGFCSFIPLSIFDMFGKGYWIMFQDATTGKCVHL